MSVICFVTLHVSQAYRSIGFTLLLKMRTSSFLEIYLLLQIGYCQVFYLHVATINVDSPDLMRKFISTIVEITHNRYNTLFRV
jgi:hypothetical protein